MIAADFGCGSGGWAIPLAKKLEEGKVYAIDILEEPLSALRARAKLEKITLDALRQWRFNPLPKNQSPRTETGVITFRYLLK